MSAQASRVGERVRSADLVAALCLATDLGMGFPFEHGLHTTLIAMRLGDRLGVDRSTASQTYYACLLSHAGCTTDAHVGAEVFGGSLTTHLNPVMYGSGREVLTGLMRACENLRIAWGPSLLLSMRPGHCGGHAAHQQRTAAFARSSERRRGQASDARSGR